MPLPCSLLGSFGPNASFQPVYQLLMTLIKSDYAFAFLNWGEVNEIAKRVPFCGPGAISRGTESLAGPLVVSGVLAPVHSLTGSTHISLMTFRGHRSGTLGRFMHTRGLN